MTTRLEGPLKREIDLDGQPYTLTIDPAGLTLVRKGRRKGYALRWSQMVSGEAALAAALNASVNEAPDDGASADREQDAKRGGS